MRWWQFFTTEHALTVLYLENEPIAPIVTFAASAVVCSIAVALAKRAE
jgi:hypothetical protein